MSTSASIEITLGRKYDVLEVIESFLTKGWSCNDHGKITFLPLGDEDFDWTGVGLDQFDQVQQIIKNKIRNREVVGVALIHERLNTGGFLHFDVSASTVTVLLGINRLTITGTEATDFSLYLAELFEALPQDVVAVSCSDIM